MCNVPLKALTISWDSLYFRYNITTEKISYAFYFSNIHAIKLCQFNCQALLQNAAVHLVKVLYIP